MSLSFGAPLLSAGPDRNITPVGRILPAPAHAQSSRFRVSLLGGSGDGFGQLPGAQGAQ
jgi:hypothetical protein